MKNPTIISAIQPTQIGDCICSLPAARYIKKVFPNSYSVAVLDPRTKEVAPLLINCPDIDRIYISEEEEGYTSEEQQWVSTFDYNLPLFGHYVPDDWSKTISPREANFRLRFQFEPKDSPLSPDGWNTLTEDEKRPKLYQWFHVERLNKTVVISPFVGYNLADPTTKMRSPSVEWWKPVVEMILGMGFDIIQIGMPNSPLIYNYGSFYSSKFRDLRHLSLLEAVKVALGADLFIGAAGGMSMIVNCYGQKTICPYANWKKTATAEALLPVNWKDRMIPVYGKNGIESLSLEEMYHAIRQQLDL